MATSPGLGGESPLDRELLRMMRQAPQQRTPARTGFSRNTTVPTEAPKMQGIKLDGDRITIHGTTYTRAEFRAALEANMQAQRADPKSAFNDRRHPDHAAAVSDMQLGYKFLGGELTESDEREIVTEWHEATQESSEVTNALLPHQEIAQIVASLEGRVALQRARTGQPLDAAQRKIVERHNFLEAQNNAQARKEQAGSGGWMSTKRPHSIPAELHAIERITDVREKVHAIRQQKAAWRDDQKSPFNDASHPEHKNYVEAMSRLYQAEADLGKQPEDPV